MNVTFGAGNRIVVPKQIRDEMELQIGQILNIQIKDGKIILSRDYNESDLSKEYIETTDIKKESNVNSTKVVNGVKIVSNLTEGEKFSKKYYSPCKLVIRTKNAYLRKFCDACKGSLLEDFKDESHECPYIKQCSQIEIQPNCKEEVVNIDNIKNTVTEIQNNVKVLDSIIEDRTKKLKLEQELQSLLKEGKKSIVPVSTPRGHLKCEHCGEFFQKGFLIDESFYCKGCTKESFRTYFIKYKKLKEEI